MNVAITNQQQTNERKYKYEIKILPTVLVEAVTLVDPVAFAQSAKEIRGVSPYVYVCDLIVQFLELLPALFRTINSRTYKVRAALAVRGAKSDRADVARGIGGAYWRAQLNSSANEITVLLSVDSLEDGAILLQNVYTKV